MAETPKDRAALVELLNDEFWRALNEHGGDAVNAMEAALRAAEDVGVVPVQMSMLEDILALLGGLGGKWNSLTPPDEVVLLAATVMNADASPYRSNR